MYNMFNTILVGKSYFFDGLCKGFLYSLFTHSIFNWVANNIQHKTLLEIETIEHLAIIFLHIDEIHTITFS